MILFFFLITTHSMEKYFKRKRGFEETEDDEETTSESKQVRLHSENILCGQDTDSNFSHTLFSGGHEPIIFNVQVLKKYTQESQGLCVHYYPNFISTSEANFILKQLEVELLPYLEKSSNIVKLCGKTFTIPRRQTAFGDPGLTYTFSGVSVLANTWIQSIQRLKVTIETAIKETYNFVLVNYYRSGLDHIGEHRDDERELCPNSSIASLSFGQERDFVFRHKDSRGSNATRKDISPVKICLTNGSLLLMCPPTNSSWYHSLPVRKNASGIRINLTFRKMKPQNNETCFK